MKLTALRGVGVALVTPFLSDGSVDYAALERVIDHVIEGGVQNLVSLGTTGETPTLSLEEKKEIVRFTIEKTRNRVPVIVGIGGNNTKEIVHLLHTFSLEDVAAVLSVSPYYSKPSEEGLYQHFKCIAEASPKPVILYNVPGRTGKNIPANTVLRLAHDFEQIAAIKEASGDMQYCMEIVRDKPEDFMVVSGDDMMTMPQIACGMEGVISVAGNFYAKEMTGLVRHALEQNYKKAQEIHYRLMPAFRYMFAENNPAGVKTFMASGGLLDENLRLPVVPVSASLREKIAAFVKQARS